ncbi:MAG: beta-galactosidase [Acidobacteriota bacterium]|nr:beta-galactosidase [Acidobacteriota bacterium]
MKRMDRRTLVEMLAAGTAFAAVGGSWRAACGQSGIAAAPDAQEGAAIPRKLRGRASKEIARSPLSVGFETLDRKMFDPDRTYAPLAQLGVKWARCQTGWARTEQQARQFDFGWLDEVVDHLLAIGIQPWFNVGYGNPLYSPGADQYAVGWAPLYSEAAKAAWARYVERLAAHFKGRVRHWEIWNEPNGRTFWRPEAPNAADYVGLVKMTAPVIRGHVADAVIIGGAFAGVPLDYVEECLEAGLGDEADRISFHPYRARPEENYANELRALRGLVHKYKPGLKLWQGEDGAPSTDGSTGALSKLHWTEASQAKWLLRRIVTDLSLDLELTSYFHTVDLQKYNWGSGPSDATNSKGLLRGGSYTPKPSYYAYRNLCALFDSETTTASLLIRFDRGGPDFDIDALCSACFARRGRPMYAYWYPADLQKEWLPKTARVTVWSAKELRLDRPVLIDPASGEISSPPRAAKNGGLLAFDGMEMRDYPMILTDAALVS